MHKGFTVKKYTIQKIFHTILQKTDSSGMRGGTLFSQHPDQPDKNGLDRRQRQWLF